jgi:hypothetical protein
MKSNVHWGPMSSWHHRILGGLWAICGLVGSGVTVEHGDWTKYQLWISLSVTLTYVVTAIGFILGRTWARRTMGVLMVLGMFFFLDMMMMSGVGGNKQGIREMLVAAGIAGYTLLFLAISSLWHSKGLS